MGLSLPKLAPGVDEKKKTELEQIIKEVYDEEHVKNTRNFPDFYRAVCRIVERLNEKLGNTQIKLPEVGDLREEFQNRPHKNKPMKKEEFQEIMKKLVKKSTFTGIGAKELLLYIFGVPLTALLIKQRVMPQAVPDEVLIPGVTSVTVFTLAALNKI